MLPRCYHGYRQSTSCSTGFWQWAKESYMNTELSVSTGITYPIISYYNIIITPQQLGPRSRSQERMFWRFPSSPPLYLSAQLNSVASCWPWEQESLGHLQTYEWEKALITPLDLPKRNQLPDPGLREVCSNGLFCLFSSSIIRNALCLNVIRHVHVFWMKSTVQP